MEEADPTNDWAPTYYDEITGAVLNPESVEKSRGDEVGYMRQLKVYTQSSEEEMISCGVTKPIPTRWLDLNKGDDVTENIRSRCVAQETKRRPSIATDDIAATFAATPPLEAVRMLLSLAMSGQQQATTGRMLRVVGFYDISRAHFHSPVRRNVFIVPPRG